MNCVSTADRFRHRGIGPVRLELEAGYGGC